MQRRTIAVAGTAALLMGASAATYLFARPAGERSVRMVARRFDYSPAELTVKKGVPLVLELTSSDVLMGFNLPDFNVRADMVPGRITTLRFVPGKTGTFVFYCDIFCGSGHELMQGTLTVVD